MYFMLLTKYDGAIIGPIAKLLGYIMEAIFSFTNLFGVFNIGVSIIIFTIVIKAFMIPMSVKQQKFTKMNSMIAPEIQAIEKKYKNKKDQASMMKRNEETMAVYSKYGVKPTAGCLQLIIQFPILLALYRVVWQIPAYVTEIKNVYLNIIHVLMDKVSNFATNESFINLLKSNSFTDGSVKNLQEIMSNISANQGTQELIAIQNKMVDSMYNFDTNEWYEFTKIFSNIAPDVQENIDKIESMNSFFGINLSISPMSYITNFSSHNSFFILFVAILIPVLSGVIQYISTKISTASTNNNASGKKEDENAMVQSMNMMVKIMPLMSVAFCFMFATCIGIYWIISSLVQLIIQICVNKYIEKMDINDVVAKNIEKMNAKRAKQGLPPQKISKVANIVHEIEVDQEAENEKARLREEKIKKSTEYYNSTGSQKAGSLASKAAMVQKYNEKNKK